MVFKKSFTLLVATGTKRFFVAKKQSSLKFYHMSFALHSIDICIFFYASNWLFFQIYH